ncbi:MAG: AAA family ATPase [Sulfurovum sp.]
MNEHFIKDIEIKNFKCFKDFKAEGFGRVNLIGGKNNVGKTAFMEACYLGISLYSKNQKTFKGLDIFDDTFVKDLKKKFNILAFHRSPTDFFMNEKFSTPNYRSSIFTINEIEYSYEDDINVKKDINAVIHNLTFISTIDIFNEQISDNIFKIKLLNKEDELNSILNEIFNIEKVDVIRDRVIFKQNGEYRDLNQFGDGIKHFLHIILTLFLNQDSIVYLDEIENGIHYSNLDKLWEIVLKVSKKQSVQVFATTHSKECIESYARVAKELKDEEISFIKLGKNREDEIKAMVYPYDWFIDSIEQEEEVRGW